MEYAGYRRDYFYGFKKISEDEKNVYGLFYCLLLYSDLARTTPSDVIRVMGEKLKDFILIGWGDFNIFRDRMLADWNEMLLNVHLNDFTREIDKKCLMETESLFNKVKSIRENTDKKYSEIIRETFI
jgi:hypothetical protein